MKWIVLAFLSAMIVGCAHKPNCGTPEGANMVLVDSGSCRIRIRQVTLGSELNIPKSLKGPRLSEFKLDWVESELRNGRIEFGHFVLVPAGSGAESL